MTPSNVYRDPAKTIPVMIVSLIGYLVSIVLSHFRVLPSDIDVLLQILMLVMLSANTFGFQLLIHSYVKPEKKTYARAAILFATSAFVFVGVSMAIALAKSSDPAQQEFLARLLDNLKPGSLAWMLNSLSVSLVLVSTLGYQWIFDDVENAKSIKRLCQVNLFLVTFLAIGLFDTSPMLVIGALSFVTVPWLLLIIRPHVHALAASATPS